MAACTLELVSGSFYEIIYVIKLVEHNQFCSCYKVAIDCIVLQALYEDVVSYQKVIARLQETVKSLNKTDDPSVHMKDIITEHQLLCTSAEVLLRDL